MKRTNSSRNHARLQVTFIHSIYTDVYVCVHTLLKCACMDLVTTTHNHLHIIIHCCRLLLFFSHYYVVSGPGPIFRADRSKLIHQFYFFFACFAFMCVGIFGYSLIWLFQYQRNFFTISVIVLIQFRSVDLNWISQFVWCYGPIWINQQKLSVVSRVS